MAKIRNILVAVSGLSPQILTETLYALVEEHSFVPDEIHIITTNTGSTIIRSKLLEGENSILNQFCEDLKSKMRGMRYTLCQDNDDPMYGENFFVHELPNEDIRSSEDNMDIASFIIDKIRVLCEDANARIHFSIAGGRKTMGFFAGYALSMFGREEDRLSHVLVTPADFETASTFYYPKQSEQQLKVVNRKTGEEKVLTAADAQITLADIPFLRLNDYVPAYLKNNQKTYKDVVSLIQQSLNKNKCTLDFGSAYDTVIKCNGIPVKLTQKHYAFYRWFMETYFKKYHENPFNPRANIREDQFDEYADMAKAFVDLYEDPHTKTSLKDEYEKIMKIKDQISKIEDKAEAKALHKEMRKKLNKFICSKFFDDCRHRLNRKFEDVLGPELSEIFGIVSVKGEKNLYCSNLTLSQVKFPEKFKF